MSHCRGDRHGGLSAALIDVAFTPAEARTAEVSVVIDVLRATSTIVQALAAGYERVLCADGLDRASALEAPGRVLAGERQCRRPPGFQLGNSPSGTTPPLGDDLILATTNGAPAIVQTAMLSPRVLVGCLLNLDAIVAALPPGDTQLVCSGTDGRPALDDVYVAGRISARLQGTRSDSAVIAQGVAAAYPSARAALAASASARALALAGLEKDVDDCARESAWDMVPWVVEVGSGVAVLKPVDS